MLYRHRRPLGMPAWSTWVAPGARSGNPPDSHAYGISHDPALLWVYAEWSQWASLRRSAQVGEAVLTLQGKGSRHPFAYPQSHHDRTGRQHPPTGHSTTTPGHRPRLPLRAALSVGARCGGARPRRWRSSAPTRRGSTTSTTPRSSTRANPPIVRPPLLSRGTNFLWCGWGSVMLACCLVGLLIGYSLFGPYPRRL